jgi:cob(I)alamin adenosyltransferase
MKIYTKTGDEGTTGLIGGDRTAKSDPRIECSGTIDELNAALGWAGAGAEGAIAEKLRVVQNELFVMGAHINCPLASPPASVPAIDPTGIDRLEMQMDEADENLPPLRNFILPGGSELAARLHLARTICRRAERVLVNFSHDRPVSPVILAYVNRLSDWLFVQARLANKLAGIADVTWPRE